MQTGVVQAVHQSEGGWVCGQDLCMDLIDKLGPSCGHLPLPALAQPSGCLGAADEGCGRHGRAVAVDGYVCFARAADT